METSVLSEAVDLQSHRLVECIKCYLCDHYFEDGEEPCLIFEKNPGAHGQLHDALAGILSSALGSEVSEETAHSELLCNDCNYTLRQYRTIEQLYYKMRFQILAEYNKTATLNGLPTIPIEINGILQKYLNLGLDVKSQTADECQEVFLAPKPEDFFEQLPMLGNDTVDNVDMDDAHVVESLVSFETNASEETKDSELLASLERNDFEPLYNVENIETEDMANIEIDTEDIICYDLEHFSEVSNEGVARVNSQCIESLITSSSNNINKGFNINPSEDMIWNRYGLQKNVVLVQLKTQPTNRVTRQTKYSQPQLYTYQNDLYTCLLCSDELKYSRKSFVEHMRAQHNYRFYICNVCGSGFSRRQDLNDHMKQLQHDSFECDVCHRVLENYGLLRIHKRINHATYKHQCTKCHKTYTSKHLLDSHMNMHNGLRPYNCALCPKSFTSKYTLRAHIKTHSYRLRPYQCDICEKAFLNSQNLAQHRKVHSGIKPFVCDVCSKAFVTQNNLFRHQTIHSVKKPFICHACGKAFARELQMKVHERIHTGERPFKCDICHLSFTQRSNLASHKKTTHLNGNLHKCYHCDLSFTRRRLLDYHMNLAHTAECPNKCAVCGATFECPEHHTKHMLTHVGFKPFACEVCGRQFANRENRNTHRFIHSNKKPYECLACGAGFMRKPLLFAHMKHTNHCNDTIIFNQPQIGVYNAVDGENFTVDEGLEVETQSLSQSETERMIAVDMIQLYTSDNDIDNCIADVIPSISELLVKNVEEDVKDFQFEELNDDGPQMFEYGL